MLNKEQIAGTPGVFVVIAAFKLCAEWESLGPSFRAGAAEELTHVLTGSVRRVAIDIYLSRGLKASSDYFVRVHAYDLAEAQSYLEDCNDTIIGRFATVTETLIGITKPRQYITRERSARLNEQLNAARYEDDAPRFAIVIPVKKSARWWNMSEDERLAEIEIHTRKSIPYLPRIQRTLYHSTGLDEMDFITYFETADLNAFHELATALAGIRENEFHTQWGHPVLLGTIQSVPDAVGLLCKRAGTAPRTLTE